MPTLAPLPTPIACRGVRQLIHASLQLHVVEAHVRVADRDAVRHHRAGDRENVRCVHRFAPSRELARRAAGPSHLALTCGPSRILFYAGAAEWPRCDRVELRPDARASPDRLAPTVGSRADRGRRRPLRPIAATVRRLGAWGQNFGGHNPSAGSPARWDSGGRSPRPRRCGGPAASAGSGFVMWKSWSGYEDRSSASPVRYQTAGEHGSLNEPGWPSGLRTRPRASSALRRIEQPVAGAMPSSARSCLAAPSSPRTTT